MNSNQTTFTLGDIVLAPQGRRGTVQKFDGTMVAVGSAWFPASDLTLLQRSPVAAIERLMVDATGAYLVGLQAALLAVSPV